MKHCKRRKLIIITLDSPGNPKTKIQNRGADLFPKTAALIYDEVSIILAGVLLETVLVQSFIWTIDWIGIYVN